MVRKNVQLAVLVHLIAIGHRSVVVASVIQDRMATTNRTTNHHRHQLSPSSRMMHLIPVLERSPKCRQHQVAVKAQRVQRRE